MRPQPASPALPADTLVLVSKARGRLAWAPASLVLVLGWLTLGAALGWCTCLGVCLVSSPTLRVPCLGSPMQASLGGQQRPQGQLPNGRGPLPRRRRANSWSTAWANGACNCGPWAPCKAAAGQLPRLRGSKVACLGMKAWAAKPSTIHAPGVDRACACPTVGLPGLCRTVPAWSTARQGQADVAWAWRTPSDQLGSHCSAAAPSRAGSQEIPAALGTSQLLPHQG